MKRKNKIIEQFEIEQSPNGIWMATSWGDIIKQGTLQECRDEIETYKKWLAGIGPKPGSK